MAVRTWLKGASFRQLFALSKTFIGNPLLIGPTFKATKRTIGICNTLFGKAHHEDNISNAFRHALWNFLICKRCLRRLGSEEKAMAWSKKITDLHENLFPNSELARKMDLHNNRVGRILFSAHSNDNEKIVALLREKMKEAIKVRKPEDFQAAGNELVYIED